MWLCLAGEELQELICEGDPGETEIVILISEVSTATANALAEASALCEGTEVPLASITCDVDTLQSIVPNVTIGQVRNNLAPPAATESLF